MAGISVEKNIPFAHDLIDLSRENLWINHGREADVLYVSLRRLDVAVEPGVRWTLTVF
jgi:hypothetical protein